MSDETSEEGALRAVARDAWLRYLELLDDLRPDLFRYCRKLTGNLWDAEDLVQDTLEAGFARLGTGSHGVGNPRGYVLRIASHLWISRQRRERLAQESTRGSLAERLAPNAAPPPDSATDVREAGAALLQHLAPQERAAVLLKEAFELSLEEIAELLDTSVSAVKAALHRGRKRLLAIESSSPPRHAAPEPVVETFVQLYNDRDMEGMLALMLDTASIDMVGAQQYTGREVYGRKYGWFYHNFYSPMDGKPAIAKWQTAVHQGEPVVLVLRPHDGGHELTSVMRIDNEGERIARIRVYVVCPDTVREVAEGLGLAYGGFGLYHLPRQMISRVQERIRESGTGES